MYNYFASVTAHGISKSAFFFSDTQPLNANLNPTLAAAFSDFINASE